jgi:catechol 2,3-dioxygenase-like lactoylglutathione lyase family enzyme
MRRRRAAAPSLGNRAMTEFSFVLLYVDKPRASADFYAALLGAPIVEASDTFAMLPLREGVMLGLWSRHTVEPHPAGAAGSSEIAFTVANDAEVDRSHRDWAAKGLAILQEPVAMDFGRTFVALDPDGNRLRVFAPGGA